MDNVDLRYKDSIREALQTGDSVRLVELVPGMDMSRAEECISKWKENYLETMQKIRNGQDTTDLDSEASQILYDLLDEAKLSGYHR